MVSHYYLDLAHLGRKWQLAVEMELSPARLREIYLTARCSLVRITPSVALNFLS